MSVCMCVYVFVHVCTHVCSTLWGALHIKPPHLRWVWRKSDADSAHSCPLHLISRLREFHPLTQIIFREKGAGGQRLGWPHLNVDLPHFLMVEILLPWTTEPRWLKIAEWSCSFHTLSRDFPPLYNFSLIFINYFQIISYMYLMYSYFCHISSFLPSFHPCQPPLSLLVPFPHLCLLSYFLTSLLAAPSLTLVLPWVWDYSIESGGLTSGYILKTLIPTTTQNLSIANSSTVEGREPQILPIYDCCWQVQAISAAVCSRSQWLCLSPRCLPWFAHSPAMCEGCLFATSLASLCYFLSTWGKMIRVLIYPFFIINTAIRFVGHWDSFFWEASTPIVCPTHLSFHWQGLLHSRLVSPWRCVSCPICEWMHESVGVCVHMCVCMHAWRLEISLVSSSSLSALFLGASQCAFGSFPQLDWGQQWHLPMSVSYPPAFKYRDHVRVSQLPGCHTNADDLNPASYACFIHWAVSTAPHLLT